MPSLGADMTAGTLVEWRRHVGEHVARGDIIAEVETEKGIIEVEVFSEGVIEKLLVAPGQKVPVGTTLAILSEGGSAAIATPAVEAEPAPPAAQDLPQPAHAPLATPSARRLARERGIDTATLSGTGRHGTITMDDVRHAPSARKPVPTPAAGINARYSPLARKRARDLGVELSALRASAPDGVIHVRDVEEAARQAPLPLERSHVDGQPAMRRAIAAAMARSKREIPHYYLSHTIDLEPALAHLESHNRDRPVSERLLAGVLFLRATARAAREVPDLNGTFVDGVHRPDARVHVGVAVHLRQGGLVAPAIHDADRLSLVDLMAALTDVVARARKGTLRSSEMTDATITLTSLGDRGVETVFPIIVPPQVAIVGFGKIVERPWAVDGAIVPRRVVTATLGADHRVSDGHRGALLLAAIGDFLEHPEKP